MSHLEADLAASLEPLLGASPARFLIEAIDYTPDPERNISIYRSMAIALLGDALERLQRYQKMLSLTPELARNLTADVVINFYEQP